jgi:hypothetical protein
LLTGRCDGEFSRAIFLDDSGPLTNLVRTHGRCGQGSHCVGLPTGGHWKVMTAVAAIRLDRLTASATIDCPMNGEAFDVYVERALLPTLRPGDVVAMDNLSAHKLTRVQKLIESAGATVLLLPLRLRYRREGSRL